MSAEAVRSAIESLITPDDPWTSRREVRQRAKNGTGETLVETTKEQVDQWVYELVDRGEICYWGGLLTLTENQYLDAALELEHEAEISRKILVGKINQIKAGVWDFSKESPGPSDGFLEGEEGGTR